MSCRPVRLSRKYGAEYQFRSDADHRDFVAIGTAAGVATAFNAPIGGLLFTIEEGASFYSVSIFWRGFLATCTGVMTLHALVRSFRHRSAAYELGSPSSHLLPSTVPANFSKVLHRMQQHRSGAAFSMVYVYLLSTKFGALDAAAQYVNRLHQFLRTRPQQTTFLDPTNMFTRPYIL